MINALQFGMDQLHDSPTEASILFIHWYVWLYYAGSLFVGFIDFIAVCIQRKKLWFLLEPAGINPYKLVYRVVKFAISTRFL